MKKMLYILLHLLVPCAAVNAQWQVTDTIDHANFMQIHFWDADHGIVAGQLQGRFLLTANGGQNWDTITVPYLAPPGTDNLTDMQFLNSNLGFACGGGSFTIINSILLMTRDAGHTWDSVSVNLPGVYGFNGIDMHIYNNKVEGVAFDFVRLFTTADSGRTLIQANVPYQNFYIQEAVMPAEGIILMAGGNGTRMNEIYVSKDWGNSWQLSFSDTLTIISMDMRSNRGYASCSNGWIISTANGGMSWTKSKLAADDITANKVKFGNNNYIYATAFKTDGSAAYVFGSDDNGSTWHGSLVDTNIWLADISMPTTGTGYTIANRKLYKTSNGGGLGLTVENIYPKDEGMRLYPNPVSEQLHIDLNVGVALQQVLLFDGAGKKMEIKLHGQNIDMSGLAKGIYFIRVTTNKGEYKSKVLVN